MLHEDFMRRSISLSLTKMREGCGGPFGCVIVRNGEVIAEGWNSVIELNDPTAHAEIVAIRAACKKLGTFQLDGCTIYASCEPCPMCLGAIYWARPEKIFYAATRHDAAEAGFDDSFIYDELNSPEHQRKIQMIPLLREEACKALQDWIRKEDKKLY